MVLGLQVGLTTQRPDLQTILWSIAVAGQPNQYGAVLRKTILRLVGCMMGGLAALYAHFKRPDLFGGALAMSPSLWFGRQELFAFVTSQPTPNPSRIYFDWGAREGQDMNDPAEAMAAHLRTRGYAEKQLMIRRDAKGQHRESDWRRRMPKALRFMFRR